MKNSLPIKSSHFLVLIALIMFSCKAKIRLFNFDTEAIKIGNLVENVEANYINQTELSVKFQIKFEKNEKKQVLQGLYRIKEDSIIWLSIGPTLGLEAVRGVLSEDTVAFINRMDKTYYNGNFDIIKRLLKIYIDYKIVENVLLNKLITSGNKEFTVDYIRNNYNYIVKNNRYTLIKKENQKRLKENLSLEEKIDSISIIPEIYKVERISYQNKGEKLTIYFNDFKKEKKELFPHNILLKYSNNGESTIFDIKIKQVSMGKNIKYPFKIPYKRYTEIE